LIRVFDGELGLIRPLAFLRDPPQFLDRAFYRKPYGVALNIANGHQFISHSSGGDVRDAPMSLD
jgi:hypothetical protein